MLFPGDRVRRVVLHAGQFGGCPVIDELVLHTPLVLSGHRATAVQITLAALVGGRRGFSVHARSGEGEQGTGWVLHASGTLSAQLPTAPGVVGDPGRGIEAIDPDAFYEVLAGGGYPLWWPVLWVAGHRSRSRES